MTLLWAADYTQTTNVAAGYVNSGSQRQNGAGTFNDTTVAWPVTIQTAPGGRPGRAIPFTIPDNYRRYEQVPTHQEFASGDVAYFGWSFYLDASFPLETGIDFQVIEQIHQAWDSWSPPVAFEAMNNALYLSGGNGLIRSVDPVAPTNTWAHFQKLQDIQVERWYNIVYLIDAFSDQPNTSKISVWVDGVQLLNQYVLPCPTIVQGDAATSTSYRKQGFYHRETIHGGTIWHAGAKLATTYAEADPTLVASGNGRPGRRNLLPNPALAVDATGWTTVVTSGTGTAARVAVTGMDKPWAYRYTQTAVGDVRIESPRVAATPGLPYSGTVQVRYSNAAPSTTIFALVFYNAAGSVSLTSAFFLTQSAGGLTANVPMRASTTRHAPPDAVSCCMGVYLFSNATSGTATFEATAARVEQSDDPNLAYADGDTAGWSWLGTAGSSPSRNPSALDSVRLNQITNPYLAGDATGWTRWIYGGVPGGTLARTSVTGMDRGWAYRLTSSGAHNFALVSSPVAVTPGQWYSATAQARFSIVPSTLAGLVIMWLTSAGAYVSEDHLGEQSLMTAGVPYRSRTQASAPATAALACVGFRWTTSTQTPIVDVTAARIDPGRDSDLGYGDGDTTGWVWDGSAGVSASRSVPLAPVLPGYAISPESAVTLASRQHVRRVGIATGEVDTARPVGQLRGGGLVETLADTFEAGYLAPHWTTA